MTEEMETGLLIHYFENDMGAARQVLAVFRVKVETRQRRE